MYITGQGETVAELFERDDCFEGSSTVYLNTFCRLNQHINLARNPNRPLPAYTPVILPSEGDDVLHDRKMPIRAVCQMSTTQRQYLRQLQENQVNIPQHLALSSIMQDLQSYSKSFISSAAQQMSFLPWDAMGQNLGPAADVMGTLGSITQDGASLLVNSSRYTDAERLYRNMLARDMLQNDLVKVGRAGGRGSATQIKEIKKQIAQKTQLIRQQVPKQVNGELPKLLQNTTHVQRRKMRTNSSSAKLARKGKLLTNEIDLLSTTGLKRMKDVAAAAEYAGKALDIGGTAAAYGAVGYNTYEAYKQHKKTAEIAKIATTGVASVAGTVAIADAAGGVTALGTLTIGALMGDGALAVTALACVPVVGWAVLAVGCVVGFVALGLMSDGIQEIAGKAWDVGEHLAVSGYHEAKKLVKQIDESVVEFQHKMNRAWHRGERALLHWYGQGSW